MVDYIAAIKGIVSEVRLSPVWRFFVTHWGASTIAVMLGLLPLAWLSGFVQSELVRLPLGLLGLALMVLWLALTVAHGVWLVRAKLELWRSRRGGRL